MQADAEDTHGAARCANDDRPGLDPGDTGNWGETDALGEHVEVSVVELDDELDPAVRKHPLLRVRRHPLEVPDPLHRPSQRIAW
jgi:hypothetical protein